MPKALKIGLIIILIAIFLFLLAYIFKDYILVFVQDSMWSFLDSSHENIPAGTGSNIFY